VPVGSGSKCFEHYGGRAFLMSEIHVRLGCPVCGMLLSPGRLESDFPLRVSTFNYESNGRGRGGYVWDHNPDLPGRAQLLEALRNKLTRCIDMLDLELDFPEPSFSLTSIVQPAPTVRFFPRLRYRCHAAPMVRLNPVLKF